MRSPRRVPAFFASVSLCVLAALTPLAATAQTTPPPGSLEAERRISATIKGMDAEEIAAAFWYFDETMQREEAVKDRQAIKAFFVAAATHFGRPDQLNATAATSREFINVFIESATPDLWRNADCFFKTYAFATTFRTGSAARPAEILVDMCHDSSLRPRWMRRVDVRFIKIDEDTTDQLKAFVQQVRDELAKIHATKL